MFHKVKKATAVSKVGDYIDVHESQAKYLIDNELIEKEGVEENPDLAPVAEFKGTPGVTTTLGIVAPSEEEEPVVATTENIIIDPKEKEKKAK